MKKRIMVRYKLKADRVEENKQLVKAIFAELSAKQPEGLRYAIFGFPDELYFVHIASIETADGENPLSMKELFPFLQKTSKTDVKNRRWQ